MIITGRYCCASWWWLAAKCWFPTQALTRVAYVWPLLALPPRLRAALCHLSTEQFFGVSKYQAALFANGQDGPTYLNSDFTLPAGMESTIVLHLPPVSLDDVPDLVECIGGVKCKVWNVRTLKGAPPAKPDMGMQTLPNTVGLVSSRAPAHEMITVSLLRVPQALEQPQCVGHLLIVSAHGGEGCVWGGWRQTLTHVFAEATVFDSAMQYEPTPKLALLAPCGDDDPRRSTSYRSQYECALAKVGTCNL